MGSGRPADLIFVPDGCSGRLGQAERFRQQVLQEHFRPGRSLEPAHLLISCPRSPPPPIPPTPCPSEHRKLLRDALRLTLYRAIGSTGTRPGISVFPRMPYWFACAIPESGFGLATALLGFDLQGALTAPSLPVCYWP